MARRKESEEILARYKNELKEFAERSRNEGMPFSDGDAWIAEKLTSKSMDSALLQVHKIGIEPIEFVVIIREAVYATKLEMRRQPTKIEKERIEKVRTALQRLRFVTNLALKDNVLPRNKGVTIPISGEACRTVIACFGWGNMNKRTFRTFYPIDLISIVEQYEEMLDDHENNLPVRKGRRSGGESRSPYPSQVGLFIRHVASRLKGTYPATLAAVINTLYQKTLSMPLIDRQTVLSMARSGGGIVSKREKKDH